MSRTVSLCIVFSGLSIGCHARLKTAAPTIDAVNVQVMTTGAPFMHLGEAPVAVDGLGISDAINSVQQIRSVYHADRIGDAVEPGSMEASLTQGIEASLAAGPPFGVTNDPAAPLLQIEITDYGLSVPTISAPGAFTAVAQARLYTPDGDRVYHKNLTCDVSMGREAGEVFVNNIDTLKSMSDAEINQAMSEASEACGQEIVLKMQQHAG